MSDLPDNETSHESFRHLELQLIEQEHRLLPVLLNWRESKNGDLSEQRAARKALIWYVISALISPATVAAGSAGIIAIIGLVIAIHQNHLLQVQNEKLDVQNRLAESQRRSALVVELSSILERIAGERENQQLKEDEILAMSSGLVGRIIAYSRSLRPYYYLNLSEGSGQREVSRPLSPERGQLLLALHYSTVNMDQLFQADFSSADLRNTSLVEANLVGYQLRRSHLAYADLAEARLVGANLSHANLSGANLWKADLRRCDLRYADLSNCDLREAKFDEAAMANADLTGARLRLASLRGADLSNTNATAEQIGSAFSDAATTVPKSARPASVSQRSP